MVLFCSKIKPQLRTHSIHMDTDLLHDGRPFRDSRLDVGGVFFRRAVDDVSAHFGKLIFHLG